MLHGNKLGNRKAWRATKILAVFFSLVPAFGCIGLGEKPIDLADLAEGSATVRVTRAWGYDESGQYSLRVMLERPIVTPTIVGPCAVLLNARAMFNGEEIDMYPGGSAYPFVDPWPVIIEECHLPSVALDFDPHEKEEESDEIDEIVFEDASHRIIIKIPNLTAIKHLISQQELQEVAVGRELHFAWTSGSDVLDDFNCSFEEKAEDGVHSWVCNDGEMQSNEFAVALESNTGEDGTGVNLRGEVSLDVTVNLPVHECEGLANCAAQGWYSDVFSVGSER